jgi:hypothetical protein
MQAVRKPLIAAVEGMAVSLVFLTTVPEVLVEARLTILLLGIDSSEGALSLLSW